MVCTMAWWYVLQLADPSGRPGETAAFDETHPSGQEVKLRLQQQ